MLIAVIADNSHIRVNGFKGDELAMTASIATEPRQTVDYYICIFDQLFSFNGVKKERIEGVVLGSVVPQLTGALSSALGWVTGRRVLNVSSGVKTGLNIRSDQPQQVGADRVAAAVAAKARGKLPCVVVDCGAATTFTVLDQDGALVASAITAGVRMSLDALHAQSAQLPTVALDNGVKYDVLARNTADAMRVGAVVGAAAMIDGMVARYAEALGETPQVWLTGEGGQLVARHIETCWDGADDLVFEGLRLIWEKNHPNR
ncbi:MAG TPA: type III pantothenate kinase [Candidatus Agathobaculum merdigallinarum]|nr:type III pantothenate kinase [Candidatus Agathobaculum merdigallinarum]